MTDEKVEATNTEGNPTEANVAELEREAAAFMGMEVPTGEQEHIDQAEPSSDEAEPTATQSEAGTESATQAKAGETTEAQAEGTKAPDISDEEKAILNEIRTIKEVAGTPFKGGVKDIVDAWKNATKRIQELSEAHKPVEPYVARLQNDPKFKVAVDQLIAISENPQLAEAYAAQYLGQGMNVRPDPAQYDLYDPNQRAQYDQAVAAYEQRMIQSTINARLGSIEQERLLEQRKWEFKQQYPDVDPESVLKDAPKLASVNPLVNAHKALAYDGLVEKHKAEIANLRSTIEQEVRKEYEGKIRTAAQTTTPTSTAPPQPKVSISDIIAHVTRYGSESAARKYGADKVTEAVQKQTESAFS